MTYDFAHQEATRRTHELGTIHHVVYISGYGDFGYLVLARPLSDIQHERYAVVDTIEPETGISFETFLDDHLANR